MRTTSHAYLSPLPCHSSTRSSLDLLLWYRNPTRVYTQPERPFFHLFFFRFTMDYTIDYYTRVYTRLGKKSWEFLQAHTSANVKSL